MKKRIPQPQPKKKRIKNKSGGAKGRREIPKQKKNMPAAETDAPGATKKVKRASTVPSWCLRTVGGEGNERGKNKVAERAQ